MILRSVEEVRESARKYLEGSPPMDKLIPYTGSLKYLRDSGITLRYAVLRSAVHHYFTSTSAKSLPSEIASGTQWETIPVV